jgi:hypothetical protein
VEERLNRRDAVAGRVDADDGVAAAVGEAFEDAGGDAARIVGRVIRLEARRETAGKSDGRPEARHDDALLGCGDEVLHTHDLGHGGGHLRRDAGGESGETLGGRVVREKPVAKLADGEVGDGSERGGIVRVADQARDLVGLVRDQGVGEERFQRRVGELHLRADPLLGGGRGDPSQLIAGARGRGFRHQLAQVHTGAASPRSRNAVSSSGDRTSLWRPCRAKYATPKTNQTAAPMTPLL